GILLISATLHAQSKKLTGKVTDKANGASIEGVTVSTKASSVITDAMGNYSINASKGDRIQITYIGYQPESFKVGDNDVFDISLSQSAVQLNEITVTALGVRKETKKLGYAVQEVK